MASTAPLIRSIRITKRTKTLYSIPTSTTSGHHHHHHHTLSPSPSTCKYGHLDQEVSSKYRLSSRDWIMLSTTISSGYPGLALARSVRSVRSCWTGTGSIALYSTRSKSGSGSGKITTTTAKPIPSPSSSASSSSSLRTKAAPMNVPRSAMFPRGSSNHQLRTRSPFHQTNQPLLFTYPMNKSIPSPSTKEKIPWSLVKDDGTDVLSVNGYGSTTEPIGALTRWSQNQQNMVSEMTNKGRKRPPPPPVSRDQIRRTALATDIQKSLDKRIDSIIYSGSTGGIGSPGYIDAATTFAWAQYPVGGSSTGGASGGATLMARAQQSSTTTTDLDRKLVASMLDLQDVDGSRSFLHPSDSLSSSSTIPSMISDGSRLGPLEESDLKRMLKKFLWLARSDQVSRRDIEHDLRQIGLHLQAMSERASPFLHTIAGRLDMIGAGLEKLVSVVGTTYKSSLLNVQHQGQPPLQGQPQKRIFKRLTSASQAEAVEFVKWLHYFDMLHLMTTKDMLRLRNAIRVRPGEVAQLEKFGSEGGQDVDEEKVFGQRRELDRILTSMLDISFGQAARPPPPPPPPPRQTKKGQVEETEILEQRYQHQDHSQEWEIKTRVFRQAVAASTTSDSLSSLAKDGAIVKAAIPGVAQYTTFLTLCAKHDKARDMDMAFHHFLNNKGTPDVQFFTAYIDGLAKQGRMDHVQEVYREMRYRRLEPNHVTFGAMMDGYGKKGDLKSMITVLELMQQRKMEPNLEIFTILLYGFIRAQKIDSAVEVFRQMVDKKDLNLDAYARNGLLNLMRETKGAEPVLQFMEKALVEKDRYKVKSRQKYAPPVPTGLSALEVMPMDIVGFNQIFKACTSDDPLEPIPLAGWSTKPKDLVRYYQQMVSQKIQPNRQTFNILLDYYIKCGATTSAVQILDSMYSHPDTFPDAVSFGTLIKAAVLDRDPEFGWQMFDRMERAGLEPTMNTYTTLFQLCGLKSVAGDHKRQQKISGNKEDVGLHPYIQHLDGLEQEQQKKRLMSENGEGSSTLSSSSSSVLDTESGDESMSSHFPSLEESSHRRWIEKQQQQQQQQEPAQDLEKVQQHKKSVADYYWGLQMATQLYERMLKQGLEPNRITFGSLIQIAIQEGHTSEAQQIYGEMLAKGIEPNIEILTSLLKGFAMTKDFKNGWKVWKLIREYHELEKEAKRKVVDGQQEQQQQKQQLQQRQGYGRDDYYDRGQQRSRQEERQQQQPLYQYQHFEPEVVVAGDMKPTELTYHHLIRLVERCFPLRKNVQHQGHDLGFGDQYNDDKDDKVDDEDGRTMDTQRQRQRRQESKRRPSTQPLAKHSMDRVALRAKLKEQITDWMAEDNIQMSGVNRFRQKRMFVTRNPVYMKRRLKKAEANKNDRDDHDEDEYDDNEDVEDVEDVETKEPRIMFLPKTLELPEGTRLEWSPTKGPVFVRKLIPVSSPKYVAARLRRSRVRDKKQVMYERGQRS